MATRTRLLSIGFVVATLLGIIIYVIIGICIYVKLGSTTFEDGPIAAPTNSVKQAVARLHERKCWYNNRSFPFFCFLSFTILYILRLTKLLFPSGLKKSQDQLCGS